jgi:hypothetical protein
VSAALGDDDVSQANGGHAGATGGRNLSFMTNMTAAGRGLRWDGDFKNSR